MRKVKYLALIKATKAATNQGGAASTSVTVRLNPSVAVRVGKKALNDKAVTSEVNAMLNHQTFQSEIACHSPENWVDAAVAPSSSLPLSSSIRRIARFCSIGDNQRVFVGKSGRMKMDKSAKKTVRAPSM